MTASHDTVPPGPPPQGWAWVNGQVVALADAVLPVTTEGLLRGDGAFETVGVWDGKPFRLGDHLRRLQASLRALSLPPTNIDEIEQALEALVARMPGQDAMARISVFAGGSVLITVMPQPSRADIRELASQPAPWVRPLGTFAPAGAKSLSYALNMAALRAAQFAGADDALLVSGDGWVLEGTTFAVMWVQDGVLRTPAVELGIIDSISRRALLEGAEELGITVEEDRWPLEALADADEVMVASSVRPCTAIQRIDAWTYTAPGPVCAQLAPLLESARRAG